MTIKVKDFISESNWCQRALAKDVNGNKCNWPYGSSICQWCLSGMIIYCYRSDKELYEVLRKVRDYLSETWNKEDPNIGKWNDSPERTWEDIKALAEKLDI